MCTGRGSNDEHITNDINAMGEIYEPFEMPTIPCVESIALGFLRRIFFSCPQDVKEAAYKGTVRPIREYGSSAWDPYTD